MFRCTIQNTPCDMRFTSITGAARVHHRCGAPRRAERCCAPPGHLLDPDFGPAWKGWRSCAESELIDPARSHLVTSVRRDCEPLERMLQTEARGAAWLILWLDCDREGEAICQEARGRA